MKNFSEKQIQSIATAVAIVLIFGYLGWARLSADRPVNGSIQADCVRRLENQDIDLAELKRRCTW